MTEETAKRASELLHELDMLQDIKNATIKEESHWWGFADGDLPEKTGNYLCSDEEESIVAFYSHVLIHLKNMEKITMIWLNIGWKYRNYRTLEKS